VDCDDFNTETALIAAHALQQVFSRRTHRRKFMGQLVIVPGQLGEALRLPSIIGRLQSKSAKRRQAGLEAFQHLWTTLSEATREQALQDMGWYDPQDLHWEDVRSNRRPSIQKGQ